MNRFPVMAVAMPELECVSDVRRAGALLSPLRLEILGRARKPRSPTAIAADLGLPRQKVNYHVRELARHGFLRDAGRRRKRNLYEQRWVATARAYLIAPEVLGPLEVDWRAVEDVHSAEYLLALAARTQREVARASGEAAGQGKRLATLSMTADVRFEDAEQRRRFTEALRDAVTRVVAEHAGPMRTVAGEPAAGRPYRVVLGCHPIPPDAVAVESGQSSDGEDPGHGGPAR